MKTLFERAEGINFKKVFIILFAVFIAFNIVSLIYALSSGQWSSAVALERSRLDARTGPYNARNVTGRQFGRSNQGQYRHLRQGRIGHSNQRRFTRRSERNELYSMQTETINTSDELTVANRNPGNRLLHSFARVYVRMTTTAFNIFDVFSLLLRIIFTALLSLWVYVDSKKRGRNTFLWTALALITSVFGWIIYMATRKTKREISISNAN